LSAKEGSADATAEPELGGTLGRLGRRALAREDDATVEEAMSSGPSTVRPSVTLQSIVERMRSKNMTSALVTRSDGTLVGLLRREDAEVALAQRAST
jgi:predicted transcriptional regulator